MKAFIFNSGEGKRLGDLTKHSPKALVKLKTGETILHRQLRLLELLNITEIVVTTGPFENQIIDMCRGRFPKLNFTFIHNPDYKTTNSIYTMYLAKEIFDDDFIVLHGDLVFNKNILKKVINSPFENVSVINSVIAQPSKDFKGRVIDGKLIQISVDLFGEQDFALQPLYKFSKDTLKKLLKEVVNFIFSGKKNIYAETAFNNVLDKLNIRVIDYKDDYIDEIDNLDDYSRVSSLISGFDYKEQEIIQSTNYIFEIKRQIKNRNIKKPLILNERFLLENADFASFLKELNATTFDGYSSNPKFEEVLKGLELFHQNHCDAIIAIGGGSCIDTAKAIKLLSSFKLSEVLLKEEYDYVNLPLIVAPTTAGTGSESTKYSVIYYEDKKYSLESDCLVPNYVILNHLFLIHLPIYHKKSTLLDAFCQSVESFWSTKSTDVSKKYSKEALKLFLDNYKQYLKGDDSVNKQIMLLANLSGRAINISSTTAAHAMSYKLSSLIGIAHGHAVSLTLPSVFAHIKKHSKNFDRTNTLISLSKIFHCNLEELELVLKDIISTFEMNEVKVNIKNLIDLVESVNIQRLNNTPAPFQKKDLQYLYIQSLTFYE